MAYETSHNERELRDLENEIRKFGTPYAEPKPDAAYWANFRTRVMERVEPKPTGFQLVLTWLRGHAIGSSLIGVGLATAIVLGVFGLPQGETVVPRAQSPAIAKVEPQAAAPSVKKPAEPEQHTLAVAPHSKPATPRTVAPVKNDDDLASATPALESVTQPLVVNSESEYPVSLNELSESELQSVYEGLMSLDSAD